MRLYIFLAGIDYYSRKLNGLEFRRMCDDRFREILKISPTKRGDDAESWVFDFRSGKKVVNRSTATGRLSMVREEKLKDPITPDDYNRRPAVRLKPETALKSMSISDVYSAVQAVGKGEGTAGTLRELSFFSHGYPNGPVLVNTDQFVNGQPSTDCDPRRSDFELWNPGARSNFRKAFAGDGLVWLWGCNFFPAVRSLLQRVASAAPDAEKDDDQSMVLANLQAEELKVLGGMPFG